MILGKAEKADGFKAKPKNQRWVVGDKIEGFW